MYPPDEVRGSIDVYTGMLWFRMITSLSANYVLNLDLHLCGLASSGVFTSTTDRKLTPLTEYLGYYTVSNASIKVNRDLVKPIAVDLIVTLNEILMLSLVWRVVCGDSMVLDYPWLCPIGSNAKHLYDTL